MAPLEERVYRHRCVEAWSIVVPWVGFSLSELIKRVEPNSKAKYVAFESLCGPEADAARLSRRHRNCPTSRVCAWMKPCTRWPCSAWACTATRCPTRTARPCASSCRGSTASRASSRSCSIRFVEKQPPTTWNKQSSQEYGFYSNVNPAVDHPRWTQATERRLPAMFCTHQDAAVQRLRRSGGESVRGHGSEEELLRRAMIRWIKIALFLVCLLPVGLEFRLFLKDDLGANPDRAHHPHDRRLDAALPADHAVR